MDSCGVAFGPLASSCRMGAVDWAAELRPVWFEHGRLIDRNGMALRSIRVRRARGRQLDASARKSGLFPRTFSIRHAAVDSTGGRPECPLRAAASDCGGTLGIAAKTSWVRLGNNRAARMAPPIIFACLNSALYSVAGFAISVFAASPPLTPPSMAVVIEGA